jgi:hypothetical protein
MPQYLKLYGERLVDLGYTVLPIKPGSKRPDIKDWPRHVTTGADVVKWYSNGRAQHGVGINARNTPAIDVDVLDPEVAQAMSDAIDQIFPGVALMTRTGLAPKFLIPFRSDEPFRKLSSQTYTDGKNDHKVEILGDGQQFVAYATHPDTNRAYEWFDGVSADGIRSVERALLSVLSRGDAQRVIDAFELLAAERVSVGAWTLKAGAVPLEAADNARVHDDPFAQHSAPTNLSLTGVNWLITKESPEDYEPWIDVGMRLHHQFEGSDEGLAVWDAWSTAGTTYAKESCEEHWQSFGNGSHVPRTLRGLLDKHGQPPKEEHKPRATSKNPFAIHKWEDYKQDYLSTPWIVKGVLPQAEVGILYGQSGSGKTFFVLDLAATIARGADWRGRKVSACRVVYVAAEAREGVKKRMDAYDQHVCADGARPDIIASAPNLLSSDTTDLADAIGKAGLIILDTMAASHSGDENSAKDMGLFLAACKELSHATGAMVLAVHHTGKEESKGMRGSSALFAGADFVMEVFKNEKDKEHGAVLSKSRDDATGTSFSFELKRVVVGHDGEGDEVSTCVIEAIQKEVSKANKKPQKLANTNDTRYDFSREMLALIEDLAYKSNTGKVHKDEIFEMLAHKYPGKLKKNLAVVLLRLEQLGAIHQSQDWYRVDEEEDDFG